jgi:hypothetical protein
MMTVIPKFRFDGREFVVSACCSIVWVIPSMASIEVSGMVARGLGCSRTVFARASGVVD